MLTHLKRTDYVRMPWKNGLGVTEQIDVAFPPAAEAPKPGHDYSWRLSSAMVEAANPFSLFPGYERILAVFDGDGLRLNETALTPLKPFAFSGDDTIACEPLGPPVKDLGLIYDRATHKATMVYDVVPARSERTLQMVSQTNYIFVVKGALKTEDILVQSGETLKIQDRISLQIQNPEDKDVGFFHISISRVEDN